MSRIVNIVESTTLPEKVYDYVVENITSGRFQPAQKITQLQLSKELSISQIPVREAIERLHHHGWLQKISNRGAFVRKFTKQEITDICQLREALESEAVRIITPTIDDKQLAQLKMLVDNMETSLRKEDAEFYGKSDEQFHLSLIRFTGNKRMEEIFCSILAQIRFLLVKNAQGRFAGLDLMTMGNGNASHLHLSLYEALEQHNVKKADECIRAHVDRSRRTILALKDIFDSE